MGRRQVMDTTEIRMVRRNGATYEFTRFHEPEYSPVSGAYFAARTQLVARKWNGYAWTTLHNFYL